MAEKIEVGVVVKGASKAATDMNKIGNASKNLGGNLKGNNFIVDQLTGSLDKMTNGAFSGFKNAAMGLKTFVTGLKTTKAAIIATGIGALVVAFGLLVTYWDDIKVLVNGVSSEQQDLLKYAEATRDAAQDQLDITNQSEASLRLAGKSERDILNLKLQQTNEIILATEAILIQQREQKKAQVDAANRNKEIAQGFLAFMLLPLTMMLGTIDSISAGLAQLGLIDEATTFVKDTTDFMASFLFDPEKVEEEGDAVIEATEDHLRKLKNTRDGFILQQRNEDAAIAAEAEQARLDAEAKRLSDEEEANRIKAENDQQAMDDFFANLEAIAKAEEEALAKRLLELKKIKDAEEATAKAVRTARLSVVQAGFQALGAMAKTEAGQRKLAISQVLVNQGIAMSEAIRGAQQSATGTGPLAVFTSPGFTATMLAIVLGGFASIKGIMNQAGASAEGIGTGGGGVGGGGIGIASNREGPTLGLTPDISEAVTPGSIPPINAYVVQTQLADQNALAAQIRTATTL